MTDYFALLQEPRRPWLDLEALQRKFLALSTPLHPDRVHGGSPGQKDSAQQRFSELNSAYQCLRDTKERLRHLLELEQGAKPRPLLEVTPEGADFYFQLGEVCREADRFLERKKQAASPLHKAELFKTSMEWVGRLEVYQGQLESRSERLQAELKDLNTAWQTVPITGSNAGVPELPLPALEKLYRELSYLSRWAAQIRERILQLSF